MRQVDFVYAAVAVILILLYSFALAEEKEQKLYILHPLVGDVIDAEENEKYNLFGQIEGFIAVRFYDCIDKGFPKGHPNRQRYFLHLIGMRDEDGYLLVHELSKGEKREMEIHLSNFEDLSDETKLHSQANPLLPLLGDVIKSTESTLSIILIDDTEVVGTIIHATTDAIFLKGLSIPILDSMIKEVNILSSKPLLPSSEAKFPIRPMTFSVSGISGSAKVELGRAKHLRLRFGPDRKNAFHLRRRPATWTVLADSLVLTGTHDIQIPSEPLTRVDIGHRHILRGVVVGCLAGTATGFILFNNNRCRDCESGRSDFLTFLICVPSSALLGSILGGVIGSRVWWHTIYSPSP